MMVTLWSRRRRAVLVVAAFVPAQALAQAAPRIQELQAIGHARISAIYDLEARPPYAFALERENLRVLDVRDPARVMEVANLPFDGARLLSLIHGSGLYVSGWGAALGVIDISEPLQPRWVGAHPDVHSTERMVAAGDLLYVLGRADPRPDSGHLLHVLALSDAAAVPTPVGRLAVEHDTTLSLAGFAHDAGRLFITLQQSDAVGSQLVVVDVSDPSQPRLQRRIALPDSLQYRGVEVRGNVGYTITHDPASLTILDLGGLEEATLLGSAADDRLWREAA